MNNLQTELERLELRTVPRRPRITTTSKSVREILARDKVRNSAPPPNYRASDGKRRNADWSQHSCDMGGFYHGKRRATRGDARRPAYGMALTLQAQMSPGSFIRGKGLTRTPADFALYVQGKVRGYESDINAALAWAKAAKAHGLQAECRDERS